MVDFFKLTARLQQMGPSFPLHLQPVLDSGTFQVFLFVFVLYTVDVIAVY